MSVVGERLGPTIFERSRPGRGGGKIPHPPKDALDRIPATARRATPPALPELNEPEVVRHYVNLSQLNYAIDTGFYPLGSCTMKFNPKLNEWAARLPGFASLHPLAPDEVAQGTLQLLWELEGILAEVSGMRAVTLQPAAGAQGELCGILMIRAYHRSRGRYRARRGPRPGLLARDEPGNGHDGGLPDDHDPVGGRRGCRRRRVPGGARAADGGRHDHESVHARSVRAPDRRAARRRPRRPEPSPTWTARISTRSSAGSSRVRPASTSCISTSTRRSARPTAAAVPGAGPVGVGERLLPYLPGPARPPRGRRLIPPRTTRRAPDLDRPAPELRRQHRRPRSGVCLPPGAWRLGPAPGQRRRGSRGELPEGPRLGRPTRSRTTGRASTSSSHPPPRSRSGPASGRSTSPSA